MTEPLLEAIKMGHEDLAHQLLAQGDYFDLDYQKDSQDGSPLFWAAAKGLEDIVRFLILLGAGVTSATRWGGTPLHAAADGGHEGVVDVLLENLADVNAVTSSGDTPCHLAAYRGNIHATKRLVEAGADIHLKNRCGNDVMREAEQNRHYEVMRYLWSVTKEGYKNPKKDNRTSSVSSAKPTNKGDEVRWNGSNPVDQRRSERGIIPTKSTKDISPVRKFSAYVKETQKTCQTYPPNTCKRRSTVPQSDRKVSNHLVRHPLHEVQQRVSYNRSVEFRGQVGPPPRYPTGTYTWHSHRTTGSTPSEDEVDWDTSLCVDNTHKSLVFDNELR